MNPNSLQRARLLATNPAAAAMMLAATRHKAETNVKNESDAAAEKADKAEVTLDVGTGTISATGISVEDIGKVQEDAYNQPYDELIPIAKSMKVAQAEQSAKEAPAVAAAEPVSELDAVMQRMLKGLSRDEIKKQLSTHAGRLRAAKELGANPITSRIDSLRIRSGSISEDSAIDQVTMARAAKIGKFHNMIGGITDDARMGGKAQQAADAAERTAARQRRKDVFGHIAKADLGALTLQQISAQTGVDAEELEADPAVMEEVAKRRSDLTVKTAKDSATERRKRVAALKLDDVAGGSTFEQWRDDTEAQVGELSPTETRQAAARWRSFEDKANDEQERETAKLRAEARAIAGQERATAAQERAAVASERAAGTYERAERGEQRTIERAADAERRRAIELAVADMEQTYSKMQANSKEFAGLKAKDSGKRAELQRQNRELFGAQKAQIARLKELRAGTAASTYSPRQEAAITAHMQTNGLDRAAAVAEMQTAGLLPKK